eukprot:325872-Pleurochrysis_carterae.AAC.4
MYRRHLLYIGTTPAGTAASACAAVGRGPQRMTSTVGRRTQCHFARRAPSSRARAPRPRGA